MSFTKQLNKSNHIDDLMELQCLYKLLTSRAKLLASFSADNKGKFKPNEIIGDESTTL
ncbi:hypothetical protein IKD56_01610 [bacterium]|nr:hypothetical protein [bacterium]